MPVDKRLNCAAGICCDPIPPLTSDGAPCPAEEAQISILLDLGVPESIVKKVSGEMVDRGIVFSSAELAASIREIAFPGGG